VPFVEDDHGENVGPVVLIVVEHEVARDGCRGGTNDARALDSPCGTRPVSPRMEFWRATGRDYGQVGGNRRELGQPEPSPDWPQATDVTR
jgi:hypothetical protein